MTKVNIDSKVNFKRIKLALIGDGKTGSHVQSQIKNSDIFELVGPFNLEKRLEETQNLEEFAACDVAISFVPGAAVASLCKCILAHPTASLVPMVWGSTGVDWNPSTSSFAAQLNEELKGHHTSWVYASNFALGMNLVKEILELVSSRLGGLPEPLKLSLHEVHHVHKKDAPSGTALSWQKWVDPKLKHNIQITSAREGDVIGIHELTIETESEKIQIKHQAKDRSLFAVGALEAAKIICEKKESIAKGLLSFDQLLHY
jgi:4-hydroxy-tetrahydrodipicolinate reductase